MSTFQNRTKSFQNRSISQTSQRTRSSVIRAAATENQSSCLHDCIDHMYVRRSFRLCFRSDIREFEMDEGVTALPREQHTVQMIDWKSWFQSWLNCSQLTKQALRKLQPGLVRGEPPTGSGIPSLMRFPTEKVFKTLRRLSKGQDNITVQTDLRYPKFPKIVQVVSFEEPLPPLK